MTRNRDKPLVSIGIPVYNGEKHIGHSIDAALGQDYEHVKVIVCDDASTDKTAAICRKYCDMDDRIEFHSNENNVGASLNFNRLFSMIKTEYFAFLPHDDLISKKFVSTLLPILQDDPEVVVACGGLRHIDGRGRVMPNTSTMFPEEFGKDSFTAVERSIRRFNNIGASGIYWLGLHRRRTFEKTNLCFPGIHTCHVTVVAELACQGPFYCCDSELFYYRKHSGSGTRRIKEKHNFLVRRWPDECELLDWIDRLPLSGSDRRIVRRQTEAKIRERVSKDMALQSEYRKRSDANWLSGRLLPAVARVTRRAIKHTIGV